MITSTNGDTELTRVRLASSAARLFTPLFLAFFLLGIRSPAAQVQDAHDEQIRAAVATEAMLHDWRANKTRENRLKVAEMAAALYLHEQNVPSDEIAHRVRNFRNSVHASGAPGFTQALATAIGAGAGAGGAEAIARALTLHPALGIGARTGMALLGGYALNSWYGANDDLSEFRDLDAPLEGVVGEYVERYRSDADFRAAVDTVITPQWAFSPTDDIETILDASPSFAASVNITAIRAAIGRQEELRNIAINRLDEVQNEIARTRIRLETGQVSTGQSLARLETDVGSFAVQTRERWAMQRARQRDALDIANAQATVGLAATVIGIDNPELGRQVSALNRAVFGVHAGLKAYELAASLDANMGLAATALTGNFVGAALSLVDAFSGRPSPEAILMEQMQRLSEQVEQVRQEMHQRFDSVDVQLDSILTNVVDGFRVVDVNLEDISLDLRTAQARLTALARGQRDVEELIVRRTEALREVMSDLIIALAGCITPPPQWETDRDRDICIKVFGALAANLQLSQEGSGAGDVDQSVNIQFQELKRLIEFTGRPSLGATDVVGPDAWFWVAIGLERYLSARPDYRRDNAAMIASTVGDELRKRRAALRYYINAIKNEMSAFQDGSQSSVIASLLAEARGHVANLELAVASIADQYYAVEVRAGVRSVLDAEGRVVPEVRFEDGVSGWRPVRDYLADGEVPEWLDVAPGCQRVDFHNLRNLLTDELFRNAALELLFVDEMAPARLGMGPVTVCLTLVSAAPFREMESWPNRRTGLSGRIMNDWGDGIREVQRLDAFEIEFSFDYCEGESRRVAFPRFAVDGGYRWDLSGYGHVAYWNYADVISYTKEIKETLGSVKRHLSDACWDSYEIQFERKKTELAEFVRQRLKARDDIAIGGERMLAGNDAIRSWLAIAFDRTVGRSDVLDAVISGRVGLANVQGMLEDDTIYPWEMVEEAGRSIGRLESALRSRAMEDVVEYGFGHRLLTETSLAALGDDAGQREVVR